MASSKKVEYFDGKGDVNAFIVKVELYNKLKKYAGEDAATSLASRLQEPAFNVYMRMSEDDRKDVEKIKTELKKQYERGNRDREEALQLLASVQYKQDDTAKDFAFRIGELVKLAYPTFDNASQQLHVKDAFVRGLHPDMQMKVKTLENFANLDMNSLLDHTVRLEVAGVKSSCKTIKEEISVVEYENNPTLPSGAESRIMSRLDGLEDVVSRISMSSNSGRRGGNQGSNGNSNAQKKCWNCNGTDHVLRRCPKRFCPACGKQGHDPRDPVCSKSS